VNLYAVETGNESIWDYRNDEECTLMLNDCSSSRSKFNEASGGFEGIEGVGSDELRNSVVRG
jgi:hypothetical protein